MHCMGNQTGKTDELIITTEAKQQAQNNMAQIGYINMEGMITVGWNKTGSTEKGNGESH